MQEVYHYMAHLNIKDRTGKISSPKAVSCSQCRQQLSLPVKHHDEGPMALSLRSLCNRMCRSPWVVGLELGHQPGQRWGTKPPTVTSVPSWQHAARCRLETCLSIARASGLLHFSKKAKSIALLPQIVLHVGAVWEERLKKHPNENTPPQQCPSPHPSGLAANSQSSESQVRCRTGFSEQWLWQILLAYKRVKQKGSSL